MNVLQPVGIVERMALLLPLRGGGGVGVAGCASEKARRQTASLRLARSSEKRLLVEAGICHLSSHKRGMSNSEARRPSRGIRPGGSEYYEISGEAGPRGEPLEVVRHSKTQLERRRARQAGVNLGITLALDW